MWENNFKMDLYEGTLVEYGLHSFGWGQGLGYERSGATKDRLFRDSF